MSFGARPKDGAKYNYASQVVNRNQTTELDLLSFTIMQLTAIIITVAFENTFTVFLYI